MHDTLLKTVQNCEVMCEYMVTFLGEKEGVETRNTQIRLLRDCADICTLTAKYLARRSVFTKYCANLCAYVCNMCARECMKFKDPESQNCAQICMNCARECREYAMMP